MPRDAHAALRASGVRGVVFGDIHLADVRAWYEERVKAAGLEHVEPAGRAVF
jgi:diphthamide synthase (EF-2-diphthine--ammonia ligase)